MAARIAYDQRWADANAWEVVCDIHIFVDGSDTPVATGDVDPKRSPDGSRIAFPSSSYANLDEILVVNLADGGVVNITNHPARDGSKVAFESDRDGSAELFVMNADGSGPTRLTYNVGSRGQPAWAPDGDRIAFTCEVESINIDVCTINADMAALPKALAHSNVRITPPKSTLAVVQIGG